MHDGTVHSGGPPPAGSQSNNPFQVDPYNPYGYGNPYANMTPTDYEYNPFTGSYVSESTGAVGASGGPSVGRCKNLITGYKFDRLQRENPRGRERIQQG